MSDTIETKTKVKRVAKAKVDKYNGFKVPPKGQKTTKWAVFLYDMMKEANPELLLNDQVKIAYNNLVDCLIKYDGILESWAPSKYNKYDKYTNGIVLKKDSYSELMGIPARWQYTWQQQNDPIIRPKMKTDSQNIIDTYTVLYELIKRDIVPYIELKHHDIKGKKDIEYYHNMMEKLERDIKAYEQSIENTRKTLCEYAQKALKLQEPPVLTMFD